MHNYYKQTNNIKNNKEYSNTIFFPKYVKEIVLLQLTKHKNLEYVVMEQFDVEEHQ